MRMCQSCQIVRYLAEPSEFALRAPQTTIVIPETTIVIPEKEAVSKLSIPVRHIRKEP